MVSHPKVPASPPAPLRRQDGDIVEFREVLWCIHRTRGEHVMEWNAMRRYGPLPSARFAPHPEPPGPGAEGVTYAGVDIATALAEVFQETRVVDTASWAPQATAWVPARSLQLLDLTGTWALRNGAAAALTAAPRPTCREWARAIRSTWPDLDGLLYESTMTGHRNVVLWNPAVETFPARPSFSRSLSHPVLWEVCRRVAVEDLGYAIV